MTGFASCVLFETHVENNAAEGYEVTLDLSKFSPVVALNSAIRYENIQFHCTKQYNMTNISVIKNVEEDMIVSGGETDTIGGKELVISYAGQEYKIPYTVKYKIDFADRGRIFNTQYVMSAEEIVIPESNRKGYSFANDWGEEIPQQLTDNLFLEARYYDDSRQAPALSQTLEMVYEPNLTLGDFPLPSNKNGEWVYVEDTETALSEVGEYVFNAQFIPVDEMVAPKRAEITINILPIQVEFTVGEEQFVYDGQSYFPHFTMSKDVEMEVHGESQTEAGVYTYALLVTEPHHEGAYFGSFEIVKPDVTITIQDASMKYGDSMPEIVYTVEGFEDEALLGLQLLTPNVTAAGDYELNVAVTNPNVNVTCVKATLHVEKGDLLVSDPTLSTEQTPAIYENPISSVTLSGDYRGVWTWKEPTAVIDSVESFTATAVFTPNNPNYNGIEREITITNLDRRTLEITVLSCEYVYTGEEHTIVYEVEDGKNVTVNGVISATEAGSYQTQLVIDETYYKGSKAVTLFIDKATPTTDFSTVYTRTWNAYLVLSDIDLPENYTWDVPETQLSRVVGTNEYAATYTPDDTANYYTISGAFTVTVEKEQGVLHGVKDAYAFTYQKDVSQTLSGITSTPSDGTIAYTYLLNGEKVQELQAAGTYEVTVDLLESAYYTAAQVKTQVVITKAVNTDVVTLEQSAYCGAKMSSLALPTNEFGVWSWADVAEDATVGAVGTHTYTAIYTPYDPANYETRSVNVSVTVIKRTVYEPTIAQEKVYTGEEIVVFVLPEDAEYTAQGTLKATNVGEYKITLTLNEPDKFKWSGTENATIEFTYYITQADNEITALSITGWTYNQNAFAPKITADFGASTAVYYYAPVGSQTYTTDVPATAGTYNLKAVIAETANYAGAEKVVTSAFTIAKATPTVVFDKQYNEVWYNGLTLSSIELEEGFAWKEDLPLEVGAAQEFAVVYTPEDTVNYLSVEGVFTVTVTRRSVTLSGVQDSYTHTYDGASFAISGVTASPSAELVYTYSSGSLPVDVGEYTVTITLKDTAHYTFGTEPDCVVRNISIEKAHVQTDATYTATYLDTLGSLTLPTSEYGAWAWKQGNDVLVGDVGERKHTAVFTSISANHASFEHDFIVNVTKKEISKPTLTQTSFVYTGEVFELLEDTDRYTLQGNKQTEVGDYTITVTLRDEKNFAWTAGSVDPTFSITQATTEIKNFAMTGWTFNEEANKPAAQTNFGTIEYWYAGEDGVFSKVAPVNAGDYVVKARVEGTKNYTTDETQTIAFTIAKADYMAALLAQSYTLDWFDGITLAAINSLPSGYTWTNAEQTLTAGQTASYGVTYVDPTGNYNPAYGTFSVTVNKLAAVIDVETVFDGTQTQQTTFVYTGGAFVAAASQSHTEAQLVYTINGEQTQGISFTDAGTYEITITLAETAHYLAASWTKTIVIEKATATYVLPVWAPGVEATMANLSLPTVQDSIEGGYEWIWQDVNGNAVSLTQKVGEPAETVKYQLYFSSNNQNYKSFTIPVTITIGKTMWAIALEKTTFTYTGDVLPVTVVGVSTEIDYTITYLTDFENVGAHTVEITMSAADYETNAWIGSTTQNIRFSVSITPAVNTVEKVEMQGWTFGESKNQPVVQTKFGGELTYSYYDVTAPGNVQAGIPENAGTYVLIATSAATDNYTSDSKESAPFTIAQATPAVTFATTYTLDWFDGITLADVAIDSDECVWKNGEVSLDVGENQTFTAVYTPKDKNFCAIDVAICVNVNRAAASIDNVEESYTYTYSGGAYSLDDITASHTETALQFAYVLNGKTVAEIKGAGEYSVTITLAATAHYKGATATTKVIVEQAENAWSQTPSISKTSWIYDTEAGVASATAAFGEVITEYKLQTESTYSAEKPENAGSYHVRFRVVETPDYEGLTSAAIAFVIEKATVTAMLADDSCNFVYNDVEYTANAVLDTEGVEYEVTDNKQTAAGTYNLCVTLKNANYQFANGTAQTTLPFTIAKTTVTLGEWTITNGKHAETAPQATIARTDSGTFNVQIKYYYDVRYNGEYANELSMLTKDSNAGTYYVKAVVEANGNNYDGVTTEPTSIVIAQADTDEALVCKEYDTEWQSGLTLSALTPTGTGAGAYVWVVEGATAEETSLSVGNYTNFKVKFTPTNKNYAPITVDVTVRVDALDVIIPTTATLTDGTNNVTGNPTYNGNAWTNKVTETDDYTISATSATNAGETVVVTFTLKENREWADGKTAAKTLTFTVQKARNEISSFTFDSNTEEVTLSATYYTDDIVTYYYKVDGEYTSTLPMLVGTYDVKVVIAESGNYLSVEREFTQAVTLLSVSLEPTLTQSATHYTGAGITVTITIPKTVAFTITSPDEGVTINGNTVTVTNAKTYTLTLTLAENTLGRYKWNDQEQGVASTTRTFTVQSSENGWAENVSAVDLLDDTHTYAGDVFNRVYNGQASIVDLSKKAAWTKFGTPTVTYYSVNAGVETPLANGVYPTNAGNYKIKMTVEGCDNYTGFTKEVSLIIAKINTVLTAPTYTAQLEKTAKAAQASGYNYVTAPTVTAEGTGQTVAGTLVYGDLQYNSAGGANSTYTLTFVPADSANVNGATLTVTINLIDVAYTGSGTSKTNYSSIENALSAVTSGVIWVNPNASGGTVNYNVTIDTDVEIKSGVTLVLPYGDGLRNENGEANASDAPDGDEATIDQRKTYVYVAPGVTVTVNGTLEVAGRLNGGGSGKFFSGQTRGNYAELALGDGATVHVYNIIKITGFITGANGNVVTDTGAKIYMPFVYGDHHGGTFLTQMKGNTERVSPFNRYQFRNIRNAKLTMKYGSTMRVYVNLQYTLGSAQIGHSETTFIGQNDGAIELTTQYSYLTAVFDPATSKNDVRIYGSAKTNYLQLSLKVSIMAATVSTKDYDFMIPSYYNVSLCKVEGNTDANNGQFTMSGGFKLLPGAKLTVEKGTTLNIDTLMVYTDFKYNVAPYEVSVYEPELSTTPAELTVNGTMIAQNLGGVVKTNAAGAKISVESSATVTMHDLNSYDYPNKKVTFFSREKTLALRTVENKDVYYTEKGTYYSNGSGWYPANVTVTLSSAGSTYATVGGSADVNGNGYILTSSDLPADMTRTHYTFSHWCLTQGCTDENCQGVKVGDTLYKDTTIYAIWTADEYTMKFINAYDGTTAESSLQDVVFTVETPLIALSTPTAPVDGYNFGGWFTAAVGGTAIDSIIVSNYADLALANGGEITIYAHWTGEKVYTVQYNVANSASGNSIAVQESAPVQGDAIASFSPISQTVSGMTFADIKEDTTKAVYFDGWYIDEDCTISWEGWQDSLLVDDTLTLYGRWVDKYKATFVTNTNVDNATTASIDAIYLYDGQSYDASVKLADQLAIFTANNTNTAITRYFDGWTVSSGTVTDNTFTLTADSTITVVWGNKVSITAGTMTNASVSIGGELKDTTYYVPGAITFTISYTETDSKTFTIKGCNCAESHSISDATSHTHTFAAGAVITVTATSSASSCIVAGTMLTLADGTQKRIEDITAQDQVLIFNHETGAYEAGFVLFTSHKEEAERLHRVINLQFSDGTVLRIVGEHAAFDLDLNRYVYLAEDNVNAYIGHSFYTTQYVDGQFVGGSVTLTGAFVTEEVVKVYCPVTAYHMNCFAEGLLTMPNMPNNIHGMINIFEFGENLKYDEEKMQADIERYGVFTYDDFAEYISYEAYMASPAKWLKVAIGKGMLTNEDITLILDYLLSGGLIT